MVWFARVLQYDMTFRLYNNKRSFLFWRNVPVFAFAGAGNLLPQNAIAFLFILNVFRHEQVLAILNFLEVSLSVVPSMHNYIVTCMRLNDRIDY